MKFKVEHTFELEPEEAAAVANAFIEWLDDKAFIRTVVLPVHDHRSYKELARDWANERE